MEPPPGEGNAGCGVHVEHEPRAVTAAEMLPAASVYESPADVDVEAKHYDDNDEENHNGD